MSSTNTAIGDAPPAIGFFERYLTVWVALCIVGGIVVGQALPQVFQAIGRMEVAHVNIPVGVLIWVMIIPMLVKIDFAAMTQVKSQWRGIGVTLFVNWFVKPFSMALLGWIFIRHVFAPWLPADQLDSYIAGLILLAAAPCTAMVIVWSQLCQGDPYFTLSQVALNDSIMIVAFAPLVALLRPVSRHGAVGYADHLGWPVHRYSSHPRATAAAEAAHQGRGAFPADGCSSRSLFNKRIARNARAAIRFSGPGDRQGATRYRHARDTDPDTGVFNSGLAYLLNRRLGVAHCVAGPSSLIGASNFFELAVATAISLFGFHSGAALATVVGVLIEVPVMLLVVGVVNRSQHWYEAKHSVKGQVYERHHLPQPGLRHLA